MPTPTAMILAASLGFVTAELVVFPLRYVVLANIRAYELFRFDKIQAETGGQRVSEAQLLNAARFGGWIGAKLAQWQFRHKTRKEPFRSRLNMIGQMQTAVLIGVVASGWIVWAAQPDAAGQIVTASLGSLVHVNED